MLWPVFNVFLWPFSVFQHKSSFSRSGVVFTVIYNNSRSIVFQTKDCCTYIELLSMIFMHQRATSFETRGKHGKSRRVACPRRKTLICESTLSENNVPTNAWTILIHTTFLSWQKFCNRGLISFKKRASSSLFFYWYIMKFNKAQIWLVKKRALWLSINTVLNGSFFN